MKKLFQKILVKVFKKVIKKAESNNDVVVPEVVDDPVEPVEGEPVDNSKKAFWKFVIQTLISILTAILTALGATSCVSHF
jgi:hypothetical protein